MKGRVAYEFKLRVTIAASGQGRWDQELTFPRDCRASNYTPVLVVLDATDNPRLAELTAAFSAAGGEAFIGDAAWHLLESEAGPVMTIFLERYVRTPLNELLVPAPAYLPELRLVQRDGSLAFRVGDETLVVGRTE